MIMLIFDIIKYISPIAAAPDLEKYKSRTAPKAKKL